jgi:hypothetical protein
MHWWPGLVSGADCGRGADRRMAKDKAGIVSLGAGPLNEQPTIQFEHFNE